MSDQGAAGGDDDVTSEIEAYLAASPVLQRVIEVNQTVPARHGGRVVVASVEVWSSLIAIHYSLIGSEMRDPMESHPDNPGFPDWQARVMRATQLLDDRGNTYRLASGSGGGGGGDPAMLISHSTSVYGGPLDPTAAALFFHPEESASSDPVVITV